jgi:hypothetical protein
VPLPGNYCGQDEHNLHLDADGSYQFDRALLCELIKKENQTITLSLIEPSVVKDIHIQILNLNTVSKRKNGMQPQLKEKWS